MEKLSNNRKVNVSIIIFYFNVDDGSSCVLLKISDCIFVWKDWMNSYVRDIFKYEWYKTKSSAKISYICAIVIFWFYFSLFNNIIMKMIATICFCHVFILDKKSSVVWNKLNRWESYHRMNLVEWISRLSKWLTVFFFSYMCNSNYSFDRNEKKKQFIE